MAELLYVFSTQIETLTMSEKLLAASIVTVLCMSIVITVLLFLMLALKTFEKINSFVDNHPKKELPLEVKKEVQVEDTTPNIDEQEEIAAIMACINIMYETKGNRNFNVNKINRKSDNKVLWQQESRIGQ